MIQELDIFFAYHQDREIAFGLTASAAKEAAEASHWMEDSNDTVTISQSTVPVHEIDAELKYGGPDVTNHICWQCPICGSWYSDDYVDGDTSPTLTACGWTRKHPDGKEAWVLLQWTQPIM